MATDDIRYDLQEADDRRFLVYSSANAYVTPYSTDTHGGELITEFNQRAAINSLLKRQVNLSSYADVVETAVNNTFGVDVEIDATTGQTQKQGPGLNSFFSSTLHDKSNWTVTAYASGVQDEHDFDIALDSSSDKITIAAGTALVYGYFIQAASEVTISRLDAITSSEVAEVAGNEGQILSNPCRTKFIKLAVQYTAPTDSTTDNRLISPLNEHDDRLERPSQGIYQGVAIVISDTLPTKSELLLGTITRGANGVFVVTNNPTKARLIPLDSVEGAENYADLLSAVDDNNTYGIKFGEAGGSTDGEVTNLINISPLIWLHFDSNLARLLRCISTNSENAGAADDEPTRGVIVSDRSVITGNKVVVDEFNCLQRIDSASSNSFSRITWHQAQVPEKEDSEIDCRALYLPYAHAQTEQSNPILTQTTQSPENDPGVLKPSYDTNQYECLNGLNGKDGLMTYQQTAMLELVFRDYIQRQSTGDSVTGRMFGPFLTLNDAVSWFQRYKPTVGRGDFFWVINDTAEAGGTEATLDGSSLEYSLHNIITNYGTVSGTVTGTAKQSNLEVAVTGTAQGSGTFVMPDSDPEETVTVDIDNLDVAGTGKGTIQATVKGTVTGTLTSFTQNVSARYVCIYRDTAAGASAANPAVWKFAHGVMSDPEVDPETHIHTPSINDYDILDSSDPSFNDISSEQHSAQNVLFAVESVERGFAIPATYNQYGLVKVGTGSSLYDVILDPTTARLRITDALLGFIKNGGFSTESDNAAIIEIVPGSDLTSYQYTRYPNGITFKMTGNASSWRASLPTTGTLAHLRGPITLDFTEVVEDGNRSDGLLLNLEDIDYLTLLGDNQTIDAIGSVSIHKSTETLLFGVNHCKVNSSFFTNIGSWKYSSFISGSNTIELELPWMEIIGVFPTGKDNSVLCRFSSITMGESGISSAMLDIWVKHVGWEDFGGNIDRMWASVGYINFPPMFFEYSVSSNGEQTSSINQKTIQRIPDNLNLRISGTSGVHQVWDSNNREYVPSGNLLVNLNWEYNGNPSSANTRGGKIYLNLYMKNPSPDDLKQTFSNLRFRAPVQVIRLDDNSMSESVSYEQLYGAISTRLY